MSIEPEEKKNPRLELPYDAMGDYSNLECYKVTKKEPDENLPIRIIQ